MSAYIKKTIVVIGCLIFLQMLQAQKAALPCYEVKYLDFFGLEPSREAKWPATEIEQLLAGLKKEGEEKKATLFLIPMIMAQLAAFHPNCDAARDSVYLQQLLLLYTNLRPQLPMTGKNLSAQIDLARSDYYALIAQDTMLPQLIFTLDDGPFYGVDADAKKAQLSEQIKMDFGTLLILKTEDKIFLRANSKKGKTLWTKAITGLSGRYLTELHFMDPTTVKNSLGALVFCNAEGERFLIYLRKNGQMICYFHSW